MKALFILLACLNLASIANAACSDDEHDNYWKTETLAQHQVCRLDRRREFFCAQHGTLESDWRSGWTRVQYFKVYKGLEVVFKTRNEDAAKAKMNELCPEHSRYSKFNQLITMAGSCDDDRDVRKELRNEFGKLADDDVARDELVGYFKDLNQRQLCTCTGQRQNAQTGSGDATTTAPRGAVQ